MDTQERPLLAFPDTNVLIQCRSLRELPWAELGRDTVEVVICGPVIRELDRLKNRGGRAGRVARAMSTTVRQLMGTPDNADVLRKTDPRVVRRLSLGSSVREPVRPGLDLAHDDQAIINQALARLDAGDDVAFITDDNFAAMTAQEFGLSTFVVPAHWLREPEADDAAKEMARRDAEIARLRAAEPAPQLQFLDDQGAPIERLEATMKRYLPLAEADVARLVARVDEAAPLAEVILRTDKDRSSTFSTTQARDLADIIFTASEGPRIPVTKADVEKHAADHRDWLGAVRAKISGFHSEWNRRRSWPRVRLSVSNEGTRPAADALVEVEASGPVRVSGVKADDGPGPQAAGERMVLTLPTPPEPPRARHVTELYLSEVLRGDRTPPRFVDPFTSLNRERDDDVFYWRKGRNDAVDVLSLECRSWRHGRDADEFSIRLWGDDAADIRGLLLGRVSASNLSRPVETRVPVRIVFEDKETLTVTEQMVADFERRMAGKKQRMPTPG